ncbi:MAG: flagellar biosynthesis protein FlhA [Candidatus Sumerlaeota bacterium]|nr:flagellar biosynthesis protein FlhA [Candidatus Sumerlaeota bacterium]
MAEAIAVPRTLPDFKSLLKANKDVLLPIGMIGILVVMVLPMMPFMMDLLLTLSISAGLLILMVALYTIKPLDFSAFPSLLLVVTLFRLSLNVASTRLILQHGHEGPAAAGHVIQAFGSFVVGGNYLIGTIVFTILVVINFVVITKGAGRVAEVSARFTLDAMPGKQMSIDADLNAGLINEDQARARRRQIEQEADFYGAMDGASKFVRGDAIAGIIITIVNIVGGLVIGVVQHKMDMAAAAQNYTLLTIGDGLVQQIPALIVSTAAGIIVTRAGSDKTLSETVQMQMSFEPRVMGVTSGILIFFAVVPGMPMLPFLTLGAGFGYLSYLMKRSKAAEKDAVVRKAQAAQAAAAPAEPERVESLLPLDTLALEVGYGLIALIDPEQKGDLLDRVKSIRRQFALEMGFIVPPLHIRDNLDLKPGGYVVLVRGNQVTGGELMTGHLLAMSPGAELPKIEGIQTLEPAFKLPALWITERERERAQTEGCTVVDLSTVIATHLTEIIRSHAHELLGRQETQALIDVIAAKSPKLVEGLIPDVLTLGQVQMVLQNLLKERVSVRDMGTIIEVLSSYGTQTKDPDILTEFCRQALSRTITQSNLSEDGRLYVMLLEPQIEEIITSSLRQTPQGQYLALDPNRAQIIINRIQQATEQFALVNAQPIIVCMTTVRLALRRLIEKFVPEVVVLSHNEIAPDTRIETLGIIKME